MIDERPRHISWETFEPLIDTGPVQTWLAEKAREATRRVEKLADPSLTAQLAPKDVERVLIRAQGRCWYCNSLCVEQGAPAHLRRRTGTLEHLEGIKAGNGLENLAWCCHACNCGRGVDKLRIWGVEDLGGIQPGTDLIPAPGLHLRSPRVRDVEAELARVRAQQAEFRMMRQRLGF